MVSACLYVSVCVWVQWCGCARLPSVCVCWMMRFLVHTITDLTGIQCFNNAFQALRYARELEYAVIAQKYIERPLLVKGRKVHEHM